MPPSELKLISWPTSTCWHLKSTKNIGVNGSARALNQCAVNLKKKFTRHSLNNMHSYVCIWLYMHSYVSLKLPDECGPVILDHMKQQCRNKWRLLLKPELLWSYIRTLCICTEKTINSLSWIRLKMFKSWSPVLKFMKFWLQSVGW